MLSPITALTPSHKVNPETYGFINTASIAARFSAQGWNLSETKIARVKNPENEGFQKHIMIFENKNLEPVFKGTGNESKVRLYLLNSHDGTSAFRLILGMLRIACLNGIMAGYSFKESRVIHSQRLLTNLDTAIETTGSNVPAFLEQVNTLASRRFTDEKRHQFIDEMFRLRLESVRGDIVHIDTRANPIRSEDMAGDAFTLFNRVQEKLIRGGISYVADVRMSDSGLGSVLSKRVNNTTRKVTSINQSVKLNRACFDAAMRLSA